MTTPTSSTTAPGVLHLTRVLNAPRSLVFKAWTDPVHLVEWWGPQGFTNPRCEVDARVGGKLRIDMRGPDGTVYPMIGEFREIVEPERIAFISGPIDQDGKMIFEILNTVTFTESNGKTTLTLDTEVLHQMGDASRYLKGQAMGWKQSIDRFDAYVRHTRAPGREIIVSRIFDAPRELVWEAMTNPEHIIHWWGPVGFSDEIEVMDVKPGGAWRHMMIGPDGTRYPNNSVFTEVVKPERIGYRNSGCKEGADEISFEATWTFEDLGDNKTLTTIYMIFPTAAGRQTVARDYGAIEGGHQCLARLADFLDR